MHYDDSFCYQTSVETNCKQQRFALNYSEFVERHWLAKREPNFISHSYYGFKKCTKTFLAKLNLSGKGVEIA